MSSSFTNMPTESRQLWDWRRKASYQKQNTTSSSVLKKDNVLSTFISPIWHKLTNFNLNFTNIQCKSTQNILLLLHVCSRNSKFTPVDRLCLHSCASWIYNTSFNTDRDDLFLKLHATKHVCVNTKIVYKILTFI